MMVCAKLHIICGNCGCADELKLKLYREGDIQHVWIICENCSTVHNVEDSAEMETEE